MPARSPRRCSTSALASGREVVCLLTDMDQPLGRAVGNALEIREAIATVKGEGPADFLELVLAATARLLAVSDLGHRRARGPHPRNAGDLGRLRLRGLRALDPRPGRRSLRGCAGGAPVVREVASPRTGYVSELGAVAVGQAALHLGAGRRTKDDTIDHAVGIVLHRKRGDRVAEGESLAEIHAATDAAAAEAVPELLAAYAIADEPPAERSVILDVLS